MEYTKNYLISDAPQPIPMKSFSGQVEIMLQELLESEDPEVLIHQHLLNLEDDMRKTWAATHHKFTEAPALEEVS